MGFVLCCGFECGRLGSGSHWTATSGTSAAATIDTANARSGDRALHLNFANQFLELSCCDPSGVDLDAPNVSSHRFYIYFETLPDDDTVLYYIGSGTVTNALGVGFHAADHTIRATQRATSIIFGAFGIPVSTGQWYRIDLRTDQTASAKVVEVEVDGVAVDVLNGGAGNSGGNKVILGSTEPVTGEWYIDDLVINNDDVHPIGDGFVQGFIPSSDGTHNIAGANQFERGLTGTDITNATTDAFELINEVPLDDASPNVNDYIAAIAPANATDYVEIVFAILPSQTNPVVAPRAVEAIVAIHEATISTGNTRIALVDNGSTADVVNRTTTGSTSIIYARNHFIDPPSAAAAWTITPGNGNFLDVRMRFYSSDALPDQYWDGAMIEAEFSGEPEEPTTPGGYYACAGTLPSYDTDTQDKIDELKALRAAGDPIGQVFELVKIHWPDPTDPIYYSVVQVDEIATVAPPVSPIEVRMPFDGDPAHPEWFLGVDLDASIGDEEIDLEFWDGDEAFSDLLLEHGEGVKVEVMYWFPEVELLLSIWHGHLRQEDEATIDICKVKAVQGFRSSDGLLPRRAHYRECQAIFGGVFDTQAEIDEHRDCPYNRQILGGLTGNLEGGLTPFTSCPRRTRQDCIDRLGNDANFMLSHASQSVTVPNGQTKGPLLYSTSNGNETNLKDPIPVVMGTTRVNNMPVIIGRKDFNNNHPDDAWYLAIYEACEGPVVSITNIRVTVLGETKDPIDPYHLRMRLGEIGQTPAYPSITPHSYSGTTHLLYNFGYLNPADMGDADASASAVIVGLNDIRIYTDEETYTEEYTDNRAWHIMRMLTDKRWGYGYDFDRLDIPAFIEAACWCANVVQFVDDNGDEWNHIRALSHVQLNGRKVQQQVEDMCLAGRLSRPFLFNGKIHIVPLREMTDAELAAAPVFTDDLDDGPNIVHEEKDGVLRSTLTWKRNSDLDLPNRIECTINDAEDDYAERPLRAVEDIDAQLKAGRVIGDYSKKQNTKKYGLAGVVVEGQGIKATTGLRDLGPFDEGGLNNNFEIKFKAWLIDCLDLHQTKVIRNTSPRLTKYGFEYFRIKEMKRQPDLQYEIIAQAYNPDYMAAFETLYGSIDPIPTDPDPPTTGTVPPPVDPLVFGDVSYSAGTLTINCEATT